LNTLDGGADTLGCTGKFVELAGGLVNAGRFGLDA
jgi:hypothetical protein